MHDPHPTARQIARRYFPGRWRQGHAGNQEAAATAIAPKRPAPAPPGASQLARLLARLLARRAPARAAPAPRSRGATLIAARRARAPALADRLEAILAELDALDAWRAAADVCSAIERLRTLSKR